MAPAAEVGFVYLFAGTLASAAVLLAFVPLLRYSTDFAFSRKGFALLGIVIAAVAIVAVALVYLAAADAAYFLPIIGGTVLLRIATPVALYARIRDRFDSRHGWSLLQKLVTGGFAALCALLAYSLLVQAFGGQPPGIALASEQLIAASGAAVLLVRFSVRVRPHETAELWPIWLAALLFGIAFVAVLPYAVPAYTTVYAASGLIGWSAGAVVAFRDR